MGRPDPGTRHEGGEVPRRLERAPGARYATPDGGPPSTGGASPGGRQPTQAPGRAILAGGIAALGGAVLFLMLGQVAIGIGTLAAAAAVGWAVALALAWGGGMEGGHRRRPRMLVACGLAGGAVAVGLLAGWAWAIAEGGVLPPLEYLDQRYGLLAGLNVVVAAAAAAWRAR